MIYFLLPQVPDVLLYQDNVSRSEWERKAETRMVLMSFPLSHSIESTINGLDPVQQKVLLKKANEEIVVTLACDGLAGGVVECRLRTMCPRDKFPLIEEEENHASDVSSRGRNSCRLLYTVL
jgi:hypothetical protein